MSVPTRAPGTDPRRKPPTAPTIGPAGRCFTTSRKVAMRRSLPLLEQAGEAQEADARSNAQVRGDEEEREQVVFHHSLTSLTEGQEAVNLLPHHLMSKIARKRSPRSAPDVSEPMREAPVIEEVLDGEILPTRQLAKELGVSVSTVDRARVDGRLKAVPFGNGFGFRRTETLEVGDIRRKSSAVARADFEGDRDAKIITLLEENATVAEIVKTTKVALITVLDIRRAWITARTIERRESSYPCACGAPSDPRAALCKTCFSKSRVLNSAQIALISDRPIAPGTCPCASCGARISVDDSLHLCGPCAPKVSLKLVGEGLTLFAGDVPVRTWSAEETGHLLQPLVDKWVAQQTEFLGESNRQVQDVSSHEVPQGSDLTELLTSLSMKLETSSP
jgi:hypothetical protein